MSSGATKYVDDPAASPASSDTTPTNVPSTSMMPSVVGAVDRATRIVPNARVGTAENHPDDKTSPGTAGANAAVGTLVSAPFELKPEGRIVTFLIGQEPQMNSLTLWLPNF